MTCDEAKILLHALIDGELDAGHARHAGEPENRRGQRQAVRQPPPAAEARQVAHDLRRQPDRRDERIRRRDDDAHLPAVPRSGLDEDPERAQHPRVIGV